MFKPDCNIKYKKIKTNALKSTKNMLIAYNVVDKYNNIISENYPKFIDIKHWLNYQALFKGKFETNLIQEIGTGTKMMYNKEAFKKLDAINRQLRRKAKGLEEPKTKEQLDAEKRVQKEQKENLGEEVSYERPKYTPKKTSSKPNQNLTLFQIESPENTQINSLEEGLTWAKNTFPNFSPEFQKGLIQGIARGSFNTLSDLITFSEQFADKGTVKHEFGHLAFKYLPKEQQEALLNEGSKLFNIPRGESKVTTKFSKKDQNTIDYTLKAIDILNTPKAQQVWEKAKKAGWSLDKTLSELQIPKDQKQIILDWASENKPKTISDIITGVLADLSYSVKINVAKTNYANPELWNEISDEENFQYNNDNYSIGAEPDRKLFLKNGEEISPIEYDEAYKLSKQNPEKNTSYYSNLTVAGGTNYTENEIAVPNITPSIKGHAQFSTDNGIGWFRSDDRTHGGQSSLNDSDRVEANGEYDRIDESFTIGNDKYNQVSRPEVGVPIEFWDTNYKNGKEISSDEYYEAKRKANISVYNNTKTRRILEVQSDLFQKGRDRVDLVNHESIDDNERILDADFRAGLITKKEHEIGLKYSTTSNNFLQLLNKDGNWIPFFIKSIIQDSVKKGYESVLFPTGDTASKVEGHQTLEEFKRQKEDRIEFLNKRIESIKDGTVDRKYELTKIKDVNFDIEHLENEVKTLQEELKRVEKEGFGALKPIYDFYETRVKNSLDKIYGKENIERITDEYGNEWFKLELKPELASTIKLQAPNLNYSGDLAIEEKIMEQIERSPDQFVPKSKIGEFLQKLKNWLSDIFKNKSKIEQFIRDLNQGKFRDLGKAALQSVASKENIAPKMNPVKVGEVITYEHGEDNASAEQVINGQKKTELTAEGREQANNLSNLLQQEGVTQIWSSPVARVAETAETTEIPTEYRDNLKTWGLGEAELNQPVSDFDEEYYVNNEDEKPFPGAETFKEFRTRALEAWKEIKDYKQTKDKVAIITSSKVMRLFKAFNETNGEWNNKAKEIFTSTEKGEIDKAKNINVEHQRQVSRLFGDEKSVKSEELLKKIAEGKGYLAELAKKLLSINFNNVNVLYLTDQEFKKYIVDNNVRGKNGEIVNSDNSLGFYHPATNQIVLSDKPTVKFESLVLHEVLHALSLHLINSDSEISKDWKDLFNKVKNLMNEEEIKYYALSDEHEFLTGVFTDSKFIALLKSKPSLNTGNKNLWEDVFQALKNFFYKVLGLSTKEKTLLDDVFSLGTQIVEMGYERSKYEDVEQDFYNDNGEALQSVTQDEIKEEIEKITDELRNANDNDIIKTIDEFFNITRSRLQKLIKNRNYSRLKELFKNSEGVNKYETIEDLLKAASKAEADVEGIARKIRGIALGIVQTDQLVDLIKEDVQDIMANKNKALENITTLQYYLYTLNDWQLFLQDAKVTFSENPKTVKAINSILGKIQSIDDNIIKNDVLGLVEAFKPLLAPASAKLTKLLQEKVDHYTNLANKTTNPENKKQYTKIAEQFQEKLQDYDFAIDENIAAFLKGERGDTSKIGYLVDAFSDSPDPIVGSFAIWLKNNIQDVNVEVEHTERDYENEIAPMYDKLGKRFNPEDIGKELTFEDERIDWEGNPYKVVSILNKFIGYQKDEQLFLNGINQLKELIRDGVDVDENSKKLLDLKKEFAQWKLDYMHQEFIPEFYKKYELWNDAAGQRLKVKVDKIFDEIKHIQSVSLALGTELTDEEVEQINGLLKEYKLLGSVVQLDGESKTGEELEEALKMKEIRELNNKFFEYKDNIAAFEKAKQRYSEYIISNKNFPEGSSEYLKEMEIWNNENTRSVISQKFYEERQQITQEINDIFLVLRGDDNTDFAETWEIILSNIYGHRDEDNQPVGTELTAKATAKIKDAMERLEEIKQSVTGSSGLSPLKQSRLSELIEKLNQKTITNAEKDEMKALFNEQKSNGLSESAKKRLAVLFDKLKELQSRIPTEYYVDSFNNLSQKYGVSIDASGNEQTALNQNGEYVPILESDKLNQLLKNDDFKNWFYANHIEVEYFNTDTQEQDLKWQRLFQWNRIIPNDPKYIETKPALKYSVRVVKDEYKTKQIVGETIDNAGNYLPKTDGKTDKYINKKYERLENSRSETDKVLFKLLQAHTKYMLKAQENIPDKNKLYLDLPRIRKTKTERTMKLIKELQEKPSDIPSVVWSGIKSKIASLTDFNQDEGNYENVFADKYGNEFTSIPIKYIGRLEAEDVSLDIFRAVMKYTHSAKINQKLIELSPVANSLERVLKNEDYTPVDTSKKIIGKKGRSPKGKTNVRSEAIQSIIKRQFEGQEKKMEAGKLLETVVGLIKKLTVIKSIAYDLPASLANVISAETQNFINASNGVITHTNLANAHTIFFSDYVPSFMKEYWENKIGEKTLQSQLFDLYGFVQSHSHEDKIGEKVSSSKIKDALALHWLSNHREWGELFVQSVNALAYMDAIKVDENGRTIPLHQAYELDKDGKIKLKDGISDEWSPIGIKFKQLKEMIANHNNRIHGNYAKGIDKPEAETYTWVSIFIMMKRFFTSMFLNRAAASDVKLTKYGLRSSARFNTRMGAEHGYYLKTLDLFARELESKSQTGEWAKLTDSEKQALLKSTLDAGFILMAYLLVRFAFGFDPDDKDKYKKLRNKSWSENQALYQAARLYTETSTFLNPYQYGEFIFDSPMIWQTIKSWGDLIKYTISQEKYRTDSGMYKKGESKAKARLYKVTGIEKVMKAGDEDQLIQDYLKMRAK